MDPTRFLASVYRARVTLDGAITQMLPTDDQIICNRVREAHETLRTVLEVAKQDDPDTFRAATDIALREIGR